MDAMRRRPLNPERHRMTLRLPETLYDELGDLADQHTFGNRSALVERILTDHVANVKAAA